MQEWLLRCSTCRKLFASVAVPEGHQQMLWESPVAIITCHPTPSGSPGVEVMLKDSEAFEKVCRMLSGMEAPIIHTEVVFSFWDNKRLWAFLGKS